MKNGILKLVVSMLLLCSMVQSGEWEKIELHHRESNVHTSLTHGEYQFVSVVNQGLYKRALTSSVWSPVIEDAKTTVNSTILRIGDELLWQKNSTAGTYLSTDGGINWTETPNLFIHTTREILSLGENLLYYDYDSVYIQKRGLGETEWHSVAPFAGNISPSSLSAGDKNLYLTTWATILVSDDSGSTWTYIDDSLPPRARVIDVHEFSPDTLFASTSEGIFWSTNGGRHWEILHEQFSFVAAGVIMQFIDAGEHFYGVTGSALFRFSDAGQRVNTIPLPHNEGIKLGKVEIVGSDIYVGGLQGLWHTNSFGKEWNLLSDGLKELAVPGRVAISGDTIAAVHEVIIEYDEFYVQSIDRGQSWTDIRKTEKWDSYPFILNDTIVLLDSGVSIWNDTLYRISGDIDFSVDNGKTWTTIITGPVSHASYFGVVKLDSLFTIHVGAYSGYFTQIVSEDGKTSKTYKHPSLNGFGIYEGNKLISCNTISGDVYYSENHGEEWHPISSTDSIKATSPIEVHKEIFFVKGFKDGIEEYLYSLDGGKKWHSLITTNGPSIPLQDMELAFDEKQVAIYNRNKLSAVYIKSIDALIGESPILSGQSGAQQDFFLHAKTAGSTLSLTFPVQQKSAYELSLFSLQGRLLKAQKGEVEVGTREILLQNLSIGTGAYIMKLQLGEQKRVSLIRM